MITPRVMLSWLALVGLLQNGRRAQNQKWPRNAGAMTGGPRQVRVPICPAIFRYRPKGVFGKGVGNSQNASEMRQKCVRNASKWVLFYWEKRNVQNALEIRQKCGKNASKMLVPTLCRADLGPATFSAKFDGEF